MTKVGGKIFVCSKLGGFCKSGRYVGQVPFWEFTHVSQQDPHERTMSRFTLFGHDFTLFWQDFGTIAQTGTPRMSWRDRSQKVRHGHLNKVMQFSYNHHKRLYNHHKQSQGWILHPAPTLSHVAARRQVTINDELSSCIPLHPL